MKTVPKETAPKKAPRPAKRMIWIEKERDGITFKVDMRGCVARVPSREAARRLFDKDHDPPTGELSWPMQTLFIPHRDRTVGPVEVFRCGNAVFEVHDHGQVAVYVVAPQSEEED